MKLKILLALTVIGFVVPNVMLGVYLFDEGGDLGGFLDAIYATTPAAQITVDITLVCITAFVWAAYDGPRSGVRYWWVIIPATMLIGLCFGMPLYLYLREKAVDEATADAVPTVA
jgi:hypothetical protein